MKKLATHDVKSPSSHTRRRQIDFVRVDKAMMHIKETKIEMTLHIERILRPTSIVSWGGGPPKWK
jgi:hypothetical protein